MSKSKSSPSIASSLDLAFCFSLALFIFTKSLRVRFSSCSFLEKSISPFDILSSFSFFFSSSISSVMSSLLSVGIRPIFFPTFLRISSSCFFCKKKCGYAYEGF